MHNLTRRQCPRLQRSILVLLTSAGLNLVCTAHSYRSVFDSFNQSPYYPPDLSSARNLNRFLAQQCLLLFTDPTRQDVSHSPTFALLPYRLTLSEQNSSAMGFLSLADPIYHYYPQQTRREPVLQPLTHQPLFGWHISQQQLLRFSPTFQLTCSHSNNPGLPLLQSG